MLHAFKKLDPRLLKWAPYLALTAAVFIVYANVFNNEFVFDDEFLIVKNAYLRSWDFIRTLFFTSTTAGAGGTDRFYRPLQILIYLATFQYAGLSLPAFHLPNIVLHAANACLIYAMGRRLKFAALPVFIATLIWAIHPIHTEAIAYMSSTADPLYTFFILAGFHWLLPDLDTDKVLLSFPIYALAILSKETALVFPLLIMSTLYLVSSKRLDITVYLRVWPLALVAIVYILLRHTVLNFTGDYHFYGAATPYTEHITYRILTFFATLPAYLQLLVFPTSLHMDREFAVRTAFDFQSILGLFMVMGVITQIIHGRGKFGLALSWGFLWFFSAHIMHAGIFLPVNSLFLEHWMYLPSAGLFLGVAESVYLSIQKLRHKQVAQTALGLLISLLLFYGGKTLAQNATWQNPITFYTHLIDCGVQTARVYNNLANAYSDVGDDQRAIATYREALTLWDIYPQTHHNLALALLKLPDRDSHIDEAIAELEKAIALDPNFFQSYEMLANIYAYRGDKEKEASFRAKELDLRKNKGIPDEVYAQPTLTAP